MHVMRPWCGPAPGMAENCRLFRKSMLTSCLQQLFTEAHSQGHRRASSKEQARIKDTVLKEDLRLQDTVVISHGQGL